MLLPELESPRLRLRAFQESDFEWLYRLWIHPEVRRYLWDDQEISRELATETVRASLLSAETEGLGMWMVVKKDTRNLVGFCGFRRMPASSEVELLFGLWPQFWGQGLATEASRAAIDWLFETHDLDRVVAGADAANTASFRVMDRLEMTPLQGGIDAVPAAKYYELRRTAESLDRCDFAESLRDMKIRKTMHSNHRIKAFLPLIAFLISGLQLGHLYGASKAPVRAKQAMVASSEKLASQIGIDTLKKGGNAVDAAVAVGFALAVTHPSAGNLGGGGFMMIRFASGETACIDYRETAPAAAGRDVYLDSSGQIIPKVSTQGYRASGVPGTPAGLCLAQKKHGRLSLKEVIQPAIDLAEKGFPVSDHLSDSLKGAAPLLEVFPESRRVYLNNGKYFESGETVIQKDLARSLKAIRDEGADGFYRGEVAAKIATAYEPHGRWMTRDDLLKYEPKFRTPVRGSYRGYDVITMPPPSSGGTVLLEMLNALEGFNVSGMGAGSSRTIHLMAEAMRHAFRDRAELMGDTDFVKVPISQLILKSYASEFRKTFNPERATDSLALPARVLPAAEASETTHFSVVDKDGNAVANTYTLNGGYGSGVTIEGTGILMNNEMDDFSSKPGVPNAYGLIQGEANAIAGGKRPLSAMTPTFVLREGKLFLVIGSPGGPTIINTVLQVIVNVVDFGFTIQEAIDAPRIHHQWLPDELRMESQGFSEDVTKALEARGHRLAFRGFMGDAEGIMVEPRTGMRLGASDPRGDGLTVGY